MLCYGLYVLLTFGLAPNPHFTSTHVGIDNKKSISNEHHLRWKKVCALHYIEILCVTARSYLCYVQCFYEEEIGMIQPKIYIVDNIISYTLVMS